MTHPRYRTLLVAALFIGTLSVVFLNNQIDIIPDKQNAENRTMASRPCFDVKHLDAYPAKYDAYFNDTFALRARLTAIYNDIQLNIFKQSPIRDRVIIGRNNWYFAADHEIDSYQGKNRFSIAELEDLRLELEYRQAYLAKRGCKFYFTIAPIKASIYPEYMPSMYYRTVDTTWGEQIVAYLRAHSTVNVIDLYTPLHQVKRNHLIYYRNDNHWNPLGAFFAANVILQYIHSDFENVMPLSIDDFTITKTTQEYGNLTHMLSSGEEFLDTVFHAVPKQGFISKDLPVAGYPTISGFPEGDFENDRQTPDSSKPRLLLISDSFGNEVFPFLSEEFSRSVQIFDAWQYKLNENIFDAENPDVVVLSIFEAHVRNLFKYKSRK